MENFPSWYAILLTSFISITLVILIHIKWISFQSKTKNLPPSPWKLPIIGNFHQLGSIPHRSLQALSQKHGPIMLLHLGSIPTLVASSAEAAKEIMNTHDLLFSSRPNLTIPNILLYGGKDIALSPYGEYWRQLKSIVVFHLLSNTQVKSFRKLREKEIGLLISVLGQNCGSPVNMSALLFSVTQKIICKATLGRKCDWLRLKYLISKFFQMFTVFSIGSYIPWLSWVEQLTGLRGRAKKVAKEFDEFLEGVIEEHTNEKRGKDDKGQDFMDILLNVQTDKTTGFNFHKDTLKAVIMDIFAGGIDTTSTTLEWVMSELVRHPRVLKKLQYELTQVAQGRSVISEEDLEKMQYLKAVIKETMRLHTPAPLLIPRKLTQDVKLMGYNIPAGTQVMVNAWAIGRDPTLWEESQEFRPERFWQNSVSYDGLHFEWIPFGGGRRSCPGMHFSLAVVELAIANIVYKFDMALPNGAQNKDLDMSEKYGISISRKLPLLVTTSPR